MGGYKHRKKRVYRRAQCSDCKGIFLASRMWGDLCGDCYNKLTPEQREARTVYSYNYCGRDVSKEEYERLTGRPVAHGW